MAYSVRAMAAALGVSKSQVDRDAKNGMPMDSPDAAQAWRRAHHDLSRTVHGRIDRPQAPGAPASAAAAPPVSAAAPPQPTRGTSDDPEGADEPADQADDADTAAFRKARAQREQIRCAREQLEFDELLGKLIPLADAQRIAFTSFRGLRDAVLNVPARLKDQLAATTDPMAVERLMEDELSAAFARYSEAAMVVEAADEDADETG